VKNIFILLIILMIVSVVALYIKMDRAKIIDQEYNTTLIIYHPSMKDDYGYILDAYQSVLEEEGVPHELATPDELLTTKAFDIAKNHPTMIFPDHVAQIMPSDMIFWTLEYMKSGGNIMIVYDPGVKSLGKTYQEPVFSRLLGIQYCLYEDLKKDAYTRGHVQIANQQSADFLEIPQGKIWNDLYVGGYGYEKLTYDMARNKLWSKDSELEFHAYGKLDNNETIPLIVSKSIENGKAFYINLPLGHLKAYGSDDMWLRSMLRTFLFKIAKIPHMMNTPEGIGGFVINWHIDDNTEWFNIPYFDKMGFIREDLQTSLHITAGDYVDQPGDWFGFDACGLGRDSARHAMKFATIGSHGGWRHNWFAKTIKDNMEQHDEYLKASKQAQKDKDGAKAKENSDKAEEINKTTREFIRKYIKTNNDCLKDVTGYSIKEYAAPDGVHPQPMATEVLEDLGIIAYYYTGDSGSAPNRTFTDGKMVSESVFAFPILPMGTIASVNEMYRREMTPEEILRYIVSIIDFAAKNRTVRLFYSHMYDFNDFPIYHMTLENMMDHAESLQWEKKLQVKPMSYFAEFMQKLIAANYRFKTTTEGLEITVTSPKDGIEGLTIAIPSDNYKLPKLEKHEVNADENYYYITLRGSSVETKLLVQYN